MIEFCKHSKVFFGVIVVGDGRFLFILENSNVLVTDVYQPLVSVFRNPLVLAGAVFVSTPVHKVFGVCYPSEIYSTVVQRISINVVNARFVLWVWTPFFGN